MWVSLEGILLYCRFKTYRRAGINSQRRQPEDYPEKMWANFVSNTEKCTCEYWFASSNQTWILSKQRSRCKKHRITTPPRTVCLHLLYSLLQQCSLLSMLLRWIMEKLTPLLQACTTIIHSTERYFPLLFQGLNWFLLPSVLDTVENSSITM